MRTRAALVAVTLITLAACSDGGDSAGTTPAPTSTSTPTTTPAPTTTEAPAPTPADADTLAAAQAALDAGGPGCDVLDTTRCLLPFPSNAYLVDGRVAFPAEHMPANASGVQVDPSEWNRNDGFSPNTPILTYVDGLDAEASKLPSWTDLEGSLADTATVVLVDADTGERVPLWAEPDTKAASDADRLLEVHPAVVLTGGHTYAVGMRGLITTDGTPVEPSAAFRIYRDALTTDLGGIEDRRADMENTFAALSTAGIERADLQLAWSFTVATDDNVTGRMLSIRDQALAVLGDAAPAFIVTEVTPNTDDNIALQIKGTYTVPNFLTGDGGPGNSFFYGDGVTPAGDELPVQNGTLQAPFQCNISVATMNGTEPAHLVEYGHGLLGDEGEINAGNVRAMSNEHNAVYCATKWAGMSEDDVGNAVTTLGDFTNFDTMADRLQQGVLNQIVLGRLMTQPEGLASLQEFHRADGSPLIDTTHLYYDGNSQGGIMGTMLAAVSPDLERAVLGVTGINYSVLLSRSVDFETYEAIFKPAYPNDLDRVLILSMVQMLWDRGEGAGYVQHIDIPVLMHVAFGDWQVSELTAMIAARAVGATIHRPVTEPGRSGEVEPGWGLDTTTYPSTGSALVIWDSGSDPIPFENIPPSTSRDSHEDPRADATVREQKAAFLFEGTLIDVCDAKACKAAARD